TSERDRLEQEIERGNKRVDRYTELKGRQLAKMERLVNKLKAMPDDETERMEITVDTPLDDIELTEEQKAESKAEAAAFTEHLRLGDGRDPALASAREALMSGSVVSTAEETVRVEAELPEGVGEQNVVKTLTQTRRRYDFSILVTRLNLEVEKKIVVTEDGERRVVSASTSQFGPPRFSVTWQALATLAVMVGQFAMPFNRLATMLSTSMKRFTAASLSRMARYVATRFLPIYLELCDQLADSAVLAGDDTSCRVIEVSSYFSRQPEQGERAPPPWSAYRTAEGAEQTYEFVSRMMEELLARRAEGDREAKDTPLGEPSLSLLVGRELTFESPRRDGQGPKQSLNTTVLTGRSANDDPSSTIVFYRSHLGSLGNLLEMLLRKRKASARELTVQSDLSTTNLVVDPELMSRFEITMAGCTAHARRPFAQYEDQDPIRAPYMLHLFKGLALHEDCLDRYGRNHDNVLAVRSKDSLSLWESIKQVAKQMAEVWTKATPLGTGARYILKHFDKLTAYLRDPRLDATNNLRERLLRTEKLIEKSSMFRKTIEGRVVLDILRTILQTAVAAGVPAQEYLVDVMRADPDAVAEHPERHTPLAWSARREAEHSLP
ncbi:MAG: transposase, partial [Myxococcota bacterium]